jgi:aspartate racemase
MKTLGLIGGMSWESTVPYYRIVNETVRERLGGLHSARLILYSVDFHDIERLQQAGAWEEAGRVLARAARSLQAAGADGLALCTNTMHRVASDIEAAVTIPLLHIADPTAAAVRDAGLKTVGLLGTRFTMEQEFYRGRLTDRHGLKVIVPDAADREIVHRVIYEELCRGQTREDSRARYRQIIQRLVEAGAEGIILGCTEIALLVGPADAPAPLFDTTALHARRAAEWALGDELDRLLPAGRSAAGASGR